MKPNTSQTVAGVFTYTNFYLINLTDQPNYNHVQKIWKNLFKKNCNQKRKIDGIYNEQLHYNCLQQLLT